MALHQRGHVEVGERCAGNRQERRVADEVAARGDRSRGTERPVVAPVVERGPEVAGDDLAVAAERDGDLVDALAPQQVDGVPEQRAVTRSLFLYVLLNSTQTLLANLSLSTAARRWRNWM